MALFQISTAARDIPIAVTPVMAVVLCATQPTAIRHPFANVQMDIRALIAPNCLASRVTMDPLALVCIYSVWQIIR